MSEKEYYVKEICVECRGSGVTDNWNGLCYKCEGDGHVFVKVSKKSLDSGKKVV